MKRKTLRFGKGFNVVLGNARSQAAQMVIEPGKSEGDPSNRHAGPINGCMSSAAAALQPSMGDATRYGRQRCC